MVAITSPITVPINAPNMRITNNTTTLSLRLANRSSHVAPWKPSAFGRQRSAFSTRRKKEHLMRPRPHHGARKCHPDRVVSRVLSGYAALTRPTSPFDTPRANCCLP
jgi:hypothetical protein